MMKNRKRDHLEIIVSKNVQHHYNYWDDFMFFHEALPEINTDNINTKIDIFGKTLSLPLIIAGMTGGIDEATIINEELAKLAEEYQLGMGVGSQRAALEDSSAEESFSIIKKYNIPLKIANIGAPQLLEWKDAVEKAEKAISMIDADIVAVHLNYLQEIIQPEGERLAKGVIKKIEELSSSVSKPVILKETGAGISKKTVEKILDTDIIGIDVGGLSGTSFSAVEKYRAIKSENKVQEELGEIFWNWGIPTPYSVNEIADVCKDAGISIIATGGIRHGLDIAKAIALGADVAGIAGALLRCDSLVDTMNVIKESLKATLFLTGSTTLDDLKEVELWTV